MSAATVKDGLTVHTAQTPAQRKASERQRHKEAGRTEVRGIYADPADHAAIKAHAAKLAKRRTTGEPTR